MSRVLVGGFGSRYRRDDNVGPVVADAVAAAALDVHLVGPFSDPLDLLGPWDHADLVVIIDATRSGAVPGTLHVVELDPGGTTTAEDPGALIARSTSTHGIGLAGVWRLARAIGSAPRRVVVVGVEGQSFDFGETLSPAVAQCVPRAVRHVQELIAGVAPCA